MYKSSEQTFLLVYQLKIILTTPARTGFKAEEGGAKIHLWAFFQILLLSLL